MTPIPMVIQRKMGQGERAYDIFSLLLENRIIFLNGEIHTEMAHLIQAQLLYLAQTDSTPIELYINSPGGEVTAGLAIYDTMQYVPNKVRTICCGLAASMGAFLLATGDQRMALPNSDIMLHQVLAGAQGQASDIAIAAKNIMRTKEKLNRILATVTKQPYDKIVADTDRDFWMSSEDAKEYGVIDEIIIPKPKKF